MDCLSFALKRPPSLYAVHGTVLFGVAALIAALARACRQSPGAARPADQCPEVVFDMRSFEANHPIGVPPAADTLYSGIKWPLLPVD